MERGIPFAAVVADSFYGEDEGFKRSLTASIITIDPVLGIRSARKSLSHPGR